MTNNFNVGSLVTFKTHPLLSGFYIKGDGKYVPPIMVVKEVVIENKDKKEFDETSGNKIAERIKYICVYFDDNKSEFIESQLYESQIESFEKKSNYIQIHLNINLVKLFILKLKKLKL
jgi:hypothetical protein